MTTPITYLHSKHFPYQEAVSALVLVRPIVGDIIAKNERLFDLRSKLQALSQNDNVSASKTEEFETGIKLLAKEIEHHLKELEQVGCLLKDPYRGLVDFPSLYLGQEVYLCWQYGESTVSEYHDVCSGFEERKPIPFEMV